MTAVTCGCFLYLAALATFVALFLFYLDPSQWEAKSLTQSSWDGGTLVCNPLQKMTLHGLSTQWNYDTCMKKVKKPNATTVVETTTNGVKHYDYEWTEGGVASYHVDAATEPVNNPTSELEGHTCRPSSVDARYGLLMSYDECLTKIVSPSDCKDCITCACTLKDPVDECNEVSLHHQVQIISTYFPFKPASSVAIPFGGNDNNKNMGKLGPGGNPITNENMEKVGTCSVNSGGPKYEAIQGGLPYNSGFDVHTANDGPYGIVISTSEALCNDAGALIQKKIWGKNLSRSIHFSMIPFKCSLDHCNLVLQYDNNSPILTEIFSF